MRDALPELGVQARIGINTGEVVTGTEERLATGDAVNVAARLEQAAQPGEILIGEATLALVRDAVEVEALEPLELKGKARAGARLPARRGARGSPSAGTRPASSAGRGSSRRLRQAWQRGLRRAAVRAGDRGRRRRRRQVAAGGRVPRVGRGSACPRPLPPVRRGDHLLAGRRGAEAARRASLRSGRRRLAPLAAWRDRGGDLGRGDRVGVPQAAGGAGAARLRLRRHPVGRGDVPRPGRARRAALDRRAAPAALPRPAGAGRAPPRVAGRAAARAAAGRRGRRADPGEVSRRAPRADRPRRRAATRCS